MSVQRGYVLTNEGSNTSLTLENEIFDKRQRSYDAKSLLHTREGPGHELGQAHNEKGAEQVSLSKILDQF